MMLNRCDAISVVGWTKVQIFSSIFQVHEVYKVQTVIAKFLKSYQSSADYMWL